MSAPIVPHPIHMASADSGPVPHKYLVLAREQQCACCGSIHRWSELYALTHLRPTMGMGKLISNLRALVWPKYRLPIEQRKAAKIEHIPFCHSCFQPSLANTPNLLDPPVVEPGRIVGFQPNATPKAESKVAKPKTGAARPTLDDLMEL